MRCARQTPFVVPRTISCTGFLDHAQAAMIARCRELLPEGGSWI